MPTIKHFNICAYLHKYLVKIELYYILASPISGQFILISMELNNL